MRSNFRLPKAIALETGIYPIRWDWESCMNIITAFEDETLAEREKAEIMIKELYTTPPPLTSESYQKAIRFLNGGKEQAKREAGANRPRLYAFSRDMMMVYSGFRKSHGIDLLVTQLHWWEFIYMFMDLSADCTFCRLVQLREKKIKGKIKREEREQLLSLERLNGTLEDYNQEEQELLERFLKQVKGDEKR